MASDTTNVVDQLALWQSNFKKDILLLLELFPVRTNWNEREGLDDVHPLFSEIGDTVSQVEKALQPLEDYLEKEKSQARRLIMFQNQVEKTHQRIALIKSHLPAELSDTLGLGESEEQQDTTKENITETAQEEDEKQVEKEKKDVKKKSTSQRRSSNTVKGSKPPNPKQKSKPSTSKPNSKGNSEKISKKQLESTSSEAVPEIPCVTKEELDAAPQYVKGRLTVEKIEPVVTKLNEIAVAKYALLARSYREMTTNEINQTQDFRSSDCNETEGKHYLTDTEIKGFGAFRMDAKVKSVINILRHVGSLKEIRGTNKVRIFIINE